MDFCDCIAAIPCLAFYDAVPGNELGFVGQVV
jgi:hypothetical protein